MTSTKVNIGTTADYPAELGNCVQIDGKQIAVFYLPNTEQQWFSVDNFNPQNQRMVLSRGITGDQDGTPIIICPLHKYRYSLLDGSCLTDESYSISTYKVIVEGEEVYLEL